MRLKSFSFRFTIALLTLLGAEGSNTAHAGVIDFTGINLSSASSPSGQNFSFFVGSGTTTGSLNVTVLSGNISSLQTGLVPDPNGLYVISSGATATPIVLRLTFDSTYNLLINQNETLTQLEKNKFTTDSGSWSLISSSNTNSSSSGSSIELQGKFNTPPYGEYSIQGNGKIIDFQIENLAGFPTYGSAISVNVIGSAPTLTPELPSMALMISALLPLAFVLVRRSRNSCAQF